MRGRVIVWCKGTAVGSLGFPSFPETGRVRPMGSALPLRDMRSLLHRHKWITYLVVGIFALATNGMAISRMTCLKGGHSEVSLGVKVGCCPDDVARTDGPAYNGVCCELALVKGEPDSYLPNIGIDDHITTIDLWHCVAEVSLPAPELVIPWLVSRPPPLSAPDRLTVISVQRV